MAKSEYMARGTKKIETDGMIEIMVVLRDKWVFAFFFFFLGQQSTMMEGIHPYP